MARIVGVHGAFHQLWGPNQLKSRWLPAVRDGLRHATQDVADDDFAMAFYGDVFRPDVAAGRPDREELLELAERSGLIEVIEDHLGPGGLEALAVEIGRETLRQLIHQLGRYFADSSIRDEVRSRFIEVVDSDTEVIVAHSMGTVVAYECLAAHAEWSPHTFITLGSPLGGDFVFPNLEPAPVAGLGAWPGSITTWTNVAAIDDTIVRIPELATRFGPDVSDVAVDNGHRAHDAEPYLNAPATGRAIAAGLAG